MSIPPTESGKGEILLHKDKNIKCQLCKNHRSLNQDFKYKKNNLIIGSVYRHPKHQFKDFTNKYMMSLLHKLSNENKDKMINEQQ